VEEENARNGDSSREDVSDTNTSDQPSASREEEERPTNALNGTIGSLLSAENTDQNVLDGRDGERHSVQNTREFVSEESPTNTLDVLLTERDVSNSRDTSRDGVSRFTDSVTELSSRREESAMDTREFVLDGKSTDTQDVQEPREFALDTELSLREAENALSDASRSGEEDHSRTFVKDCSRESRNSTKKLKVKINL